MVGRLMTKKSKKEGSVKSECVAERSPTEELMIILRGAMIIIVPLSLLAVFVASWVNAYQKWGMLGVLINGLLITFVGVLVYICCDRNIDDSTEVDSGQSDE
jgi:hypothetical protein